jgi:hypothetical protein
LPRDGGGIIGPLRAGGQGEARHPVDNPGAGRVRPEVSVDGKGRMEA